MTISAVEIAGAIQSTDPQRALSSLFSDRGCQLSTEELTSLIAAVAGHQDDGELTDEDLETVTGGADLGGSIQVSLCKIFPLVAGCPELLSKQRVLKL